MREGRDPRGDDSSAKERFYLRYLHLGTQLCLCMLAGVFGGIWLDGKLGWSPWLTITGSLAGIGLGMAVVIREVGRDRG